MIATSSPLMPNLSSSIWFEEAQKWDEDVTQACRKQTHHE